MKTDSSTSKVLIKINGENKFIPQNISILELLETYKINNGRVVIELNKVILKKESFQSVILNEKDEIEIVTFVGGG
ncbi:MAG: sulfur carrier protein ThiS [Candidatus Melainabacteria bacterium]|nr:sulfur carrier protein ThiS [Candidatus Melainabacteria bacterium]